MGDLPETLADPAELKQALTMGGLLFLTWLWAAFAPLMIAGFLARPDFWFSGFMALLFAYFTYTGIRARRRGWKARFVLRIVVPYSLLATSTVLTLVGVWFRK